MAGDCSRLPARVCRGESPCTPSTRDMARSKVPTGRRPALRANSTMRQSVNPADRSCSTSMPTTVAICAWPSPYTDSSTRIISASTSWDTHAPCATNASAFSTCAGSSLTINRTRTLASTARMPVPRPGSDSLIHLGNWPRFSRRTKHRLVDVPRRVLRRPPDDHFTPILAPLDLRPWRQSKPGADARRHRYLPLGGDLRFDSFHLSPLSPIPCPLIVASTTVARRDAGRTNVSSLTDREWVAPLRTASPVTLRVQSPSSPVSGLLPWG